MPVWSQLLSREEIHAAGRTGWTHMEAEIILPDGGAVNGIHASLCAIWALKDSADLQENTDG